jgi:hypothetical protein
MTYNKIYNFLFFENIKLIKKLINFFVLYYWNDCPREKEKKRKICECPHGNTPQIPPSLQQI